MPLPSKVAISLMDKENPAWFAGQLGGSYRLELRPGLQGPEPVKQGLPRDVPRKEKGPYLLVPTFLQTSQ